MGKSRKSLILLLCICICVVLLGFTFTSRKQVRHPPRRRKYGEVPATKTMKEPAAADMVDVCEMPDRLAHIHNYCKDHPRKEVDHLGYLATNIGHTIGYCPIPKCSSSSFLYLMEMVNTTSSCDIRNSNTVVYPLTKCGVKKLYFDKPLPEIKFIFTIVRNPFDRIVSMYYDKVVKRDHTFDSFWNYVHDNYGRKVTGKAQTEVAFTRYVDLLLDLWLGRVSYHLTFHERFHLFPITEFCDFCGLDYKYVARLETKDHDFPFLQDQIGQGNAVKNLNKNQKMSFSSVQKYQKEWLDVPANKRQALYEMYRGDFDMFGYIYDRTANTVHCSLQSLTGNRCC